MEPLRLKEWEPTELRLTQAEALALRGLPVGLDVQLVAAPDVYRVRPGNVVGAVATSDVELVVEPKIGIRRLFLLLSYAAGLQFRREAVRLDEEQGLVESFVAAYLNEVRYALRHGALMSYRTVDDAIAGVRGRIRIADQARRRFAFPVPVEVTYDDYTIDIEENRLVKAALRRLSELRLRRPQLRFRLDQALVKLETVTDVRYNPASLPAIVFNRLNEHYRVILELSRLVLDATTVELRQGKHAFSGFLVDMNKVFEDFVYQAVGDQLDGRAKWRHGAQLNLDVERRIVLKPDLSLWRGRRCVFVGDAKYKATTAGENDDLYQLLAYCEASGLTSGLLVYAQSGETPSVHEVRHRGTQLRVEAIDLEAPIDSLLGRINELASTVVQMTSEGGRDAPAAEAPKAA